MEEDREVSGKNIVILASRRKSIEGTSELKQLLVRHFSPLYKEQFLNF